MSRLSLVLFGVLLACILLYYMFFYSVAYQGTIQPLPNAIPRIHSQSSESNNRSTKFPKLIHYMWKSPQVSPPFETVRWQRGCKAVNPDHEFLMYYDADLVVFVEKEYPQYLPLFLALKGVYMADMARVLVMYHYGGIYMDLDFYCHRPFTCLIESLLPTELTKEEKDSASTSSGSRSSSSRSSSGGSNVNKDVLIVSLEPAVHANIFRDKDRVVIQDFYLATPRHPFFKWFLDDRMRQYLRDPTHPPKGPFSYSIETDIDNYKKSISNLPSTSHNSHSSGSSSNSRLNGSEAASSITATATTGVVSAVTAATTTGVGVIYELPEDILHALVDNTNPRLDTVCFGGKSSSSMVWGKDKDKDKKKSSKDGKTKTSSNNKGKTSGSSSKHDSSAPEWAVASCEKVRRRQYFSPSERTIAVHMWTHTFLGWSFFRGLYNGAVYERVERALPPNMRCPETTRLPLTMH